MNSFYILTSGCPENRIDSAVAEQMFISSGWVKASSYMEADLVLFNACGQSWNFPTHKRISNLRKRLKSKADLFVYGCYAKMASEEALEIIDGPLIASDDFESLASYFSIDQINAIDYPYYLIPRTNSTFAKINIPKLSKFVSPTQIYKSLEHRHFRNTVDKIIGSYDVYDPATYVIKISTGCLSKCSYCSVRLARGRLRSQPMEIILNQFRNGIAQGFNKFSLIGTDVGSYGIDIGTNLARLVKLLLQCDGSSDILLRNINPTYLISMLEEFTPILQSGQIHYLESAVQSGSNRILKLMNRKYTIENYKKSIGHIREKVPDLKLRTQIVVNFPGESHDDFQATMGLVDEMDFDIIELYNYRPEPGTPASKMKLGITKQEADKRYRKMYLKVLKALKSKPLYC